MPRRRAEDADRFERSVTRAALLQMAREAGFVSAQEHGLEVLGEAARARVGTLCRLARCYAEVGGRTAVNADDVACALDELKMSVSDLKKLKDRKAVGFAATLPKLPVRVKVKRRPTFKETEELPPPHIPGFLPVFPPEHTYRETPEYSQSQVNWRARAAKVHEAKKEAENALMMMAGEEQPDNPFVASKLMAEGETWDGDWASKQEKADKKRPRSLLSIPSPAMRQILGPVVDMATAKRKKPRNAFGGKEQKKSKKSDSSMPAPLARVVEPDASRTTPEPSSTKPEPFNPVEPDSVVAEVYPPTQSTEFGMSQMLKYMGSQPSVTFPTHSQLGDKQSLDGTLPVVTKGSPVRKVGGNAGSLEGGVGVGDSPVSGDGQGDCSMDGLDVVELGRDVELALTEDAIQDSASEGGG
ncbi:unnamed protein product [Ostreobium quekettii]|uniref:Transcription initiation factor TFIID subunit 8 n=1 Tax=Ostreobium quekettii TaxID=121088 RepID=A0A8S1J5N9_9CHLO|nr:unnamed protein product [Ostreobium quekettii]|eukprot:evm.model.scf_1302.5 EVM.evm.TU.scf_1302.5   scf_1302:20914-25720(-)